MLNLDIKKQKIIGIFIITFLSQSNINNKVFFKKVLLVNVSHYGVATCSAAASPQPLWDLKVLGALLHPESLGTWWMVPGSQT